jgi:hypothetical protein
MDEEKQQMEGEIKIISEALNDDADNLRIDGEDSDIRDRVRRLSEQKRELASDFLKLKNPDLDQVMFYSLMISEIKDDIDFHLNIASQRKRNRAFAKQSRINVKMAFLTKFFMFMMILQLAVIAALILLRNIF